MRWDDLIRPWSSIAKGSTATFKRMFTPAITTMYPDEQPDLAPRWRGPLRLRGVMDDQPPPVTDAAPLDFNDLMTELHDQSRVAPCMGGCPANVDARGQNALVAAGRAVEAYNVVRRRNILPAVLGYTCPAPCEDVCRRSYLDDPIAIRQLHRECYEVYDREVRQPGHLRSLVHRTEHVAVVGAGPSGLAVAYDLVQMGYRVTVFEREERPGGLLVTGVPLYRLDREVVTKEIGDLVEMGVEIRTGVEVGRDVTLGELRAAHDAVVVAVGYSGGRTLPLPGADAQGVWSALEFLRRYCLGMDCVVGPRVVVVGGGDVGCDCSRSALRCGARESYQIIRETMDEMPAQDLEARGALEEGVIFRERWNPVEVLTKATTKRRRAKAAGAAAEPGSEPGVATDAAPGPAATHVTGMRFQRIIELFDEDGRLRAEPILVDEFMDVPCDTVIFAIGQGLQLGFLAGSGVAMDDRGRPQVDLATGASSVPGLFFAGDVATGPKTIIIAIGQAHETAVSVHRHLQRLDLTDDRRPPVHPPQYYLQKVYAPSPEEVVGEGGPGGRRVEMPESDPDTRVALGTQVELGWPKGDGHREAVRCMRCQTHVCVACTMCARVCPDNCIAVEGDDTGYVRTVTRYDFVMEWCCFCGLCQDICPTQTLSLAASFDYARPSRRAFFYDREAMLRPFDGPQVLENKDGLP